MDPMSSVARGLMGILSLLVLSACSDRVVGPTLQEPRTPALVFDVAGLNHTRDAVLPVHGIELGWSRTTTDGGIALRNLDDQIAGFERAYALHSTESILAQWIDLLLQRAAFAGTFDDFRTADALTREASDVDSVEGRSIVGARTRAQVLSALHRFDEALQLLDHAERLGVPADALEAKRITLQLARGDHPSTLRERAEGLASDFTGLSVRAGVVAALGQFHEADAIYRDALASYRDVSPFVVARTQFARGVMWSEQAGHPELARPLYQEAVRRVPGYVVANVHLAELEASSAPSIAIARLEPFASSPDPEPGGRLAQLVDGARSRELARRSTDRYDVLLSRHPAAFLDHGAEFFAGPGADPDRALRLALDNLQRRPVPRAMKVAIDAAVAAGDDRQACAIAHQATPWLEAHPVLADVVTELPCRQDP